MKYLIFLIFVLVQIFVNQNIGYSTTSNWINHFIYQFQHTGWIHLILNSIAFSAFHNILSKGNNGLMIALYAYVGSVIASYLSIYDIPTIGSSGMVYTMEGLFVVQCIICKRLIIKDKDAFLLLLGCMLVCFIVSVLKGTANNICHFYSFVFGCIIALLDNGCKRNNSGK